MHRSGPLLILSPALMRWGSPRRQGLSSHLAHLWATSDLVPRSPRDGRGSGHLGLPETAGVKFAHLWATSDFFPRSDAVGLPETAGVK